MSEEPHQHAHLDRPRRKFGSEWLELTREDHILIAPLISFAAFICIAIGDKSIITAVIALLLQSILFQIAVVAHFKRPRLRRIAYIASPIIIVVSGDAPASAIAASIIEGWGLDG